MYFLSQEENIATFKHMVTELDKLGIAYIQLSQYNGTWFGTFVNHRLTLAGYSDPMHGGVRQGFEHDVVRTYGHLARTSKIMAVAGYTAERANEEISEGLVDAVAFGTLYMYNPDLYARFQQDLPINHDGNRWAHYNIVDNDVRKGYSDYPIAIRSEDNVDNDKRP